VAAVNAKGTLQLANCENDKVDEYSKIYLEFACTDPSSVQVIPWKQHNVSFFLLNCCNKSVKL
jgi:hypothetical protein